MKNLFLLLAVCLLGCVTAPPTYTPLPFDEAEYAALPKTGTGIVRGQVFAKTVGGNVKYGAGNNVVMFPATKYGDQRYTEQLVRGKLTDKAEDPRYFEYHHIKVTDAQGHFEFTNIPPGWYYILSNVTWDIPSSNRFELAAGIMDTQGGRVVRKIEVKNDAVTEIMLNYN